MLAFPQRSSTVRMRRWITIPTYNERENIGTLIHEVAKVMPDVQILIVDDNSPDGTANAIRCLQRTNPNLHLHVRECKKGLGSAYVDAFRKLLNEEEFDTVTTMDADFSHSPCYLPQMHALASEYDMVIGSRYIEGGGSLGWARRRRLLSASANSYARLVTEVSVKDLTAGFVTFRRSILEKLPLERIHSSGYAYTIELKCLAIFAGARAKEIPIIFEERREGNSKLSFRIIREGVYAPWYARSLSNR